MNTLIRSLWADRTTWERTCIALWGGILLFVCVRVYLFPTEKTVYPIFSGAGRLWLGGGEVYEPYRPASEQWGYRYGPTIAILYAPFGLMPDSIGGVVWRLLSVAVLAWTLAWFTKAVLPKPLSRDQFAWLLLLGTPLTLQSVNNGQANLILIAALLATIAAVKEERWNLAASCMALAFLLKLFPIALGMLLMLLYPRKLIWRIPLFAAAGLLVPFLCQHPSYVLDQYVKWIELLRAEDRSDCVLENMYRDLWLLIHIYGLPVSRRVYMAIQMLGGVAVAVLLWHRQRAGWSERSLLTSTLALGVTWMMLLGPSPESSTFNVLAPSLGWSVIDAWQTRTRHARGLLLWGSVTLYLIAVVFGGSAQTVRIHYYGVHSWATLLYFIYLLTESAGFVEVAESPGVRYPEPLG